MLDGVIERVQRRMNTETYDESIMEEITQTVTDRLCLRLGVSEDTFPSAFLSILVEASVKVWRRRYYEGISEEKIGNGAVSTSFVADVLSEYQPEIDSWLNSAEADAGNRKKVRFL
nr:MAG TPA: tail connector protein [Caudoviricetes sp.]